MVFGIALPVVDVDLWETGDEELQFLLIEDSDELGGNDLVEACRLLVHEYQM